MTIQLVIINTSIIVPVECQRLDRTASEKSTTDFDRFSTFDGSRAFLCDYNHDDPSRRPHEIRPGFPMWWVKISTTHETTAHSTKDGSTRAKEQKTNRWAEPLDESKANEIKTAVTGGNLLRGLSRSGVWVHVRIPLQPGSPRHSFARRSCWSRPIPTRDAEVTEPLFQSAPPIDPATLEHGPVPIVCLELT